MTVPCALCGARRFPVVAVSAGPVCAVCVALCMEHTLADVRSRVLAADLVRDEAANAIAALLG